MPRSSIRFPHQSFSSPPYLPHASIILSFLYHPNSVWWGVKIMKLLIMQFSQFSYHFPPPYFHISSSASYSALCSSLKLEWPSFTPVLNRLFFFCPMPPHVLVDFVVLPPGHGRSVTDFWGWDAHGAQLHCPDDVSGDIGGCSARRALKPKFYQRTQTMVTAGILPFRENSHGRAGNRTRDLMISSQRLWPLDHEAGHRQNYSSICFNIYIPRQHQRIQKIGQRAAIIPCI